MPITKRHELKLARAAAPAPAAGSAEGTLGAAAASNTSTGQSVVHQAAPHLGTVVGPPGADLYLLSTERSTGQPAPPDGALNKSERLSGDRPARLALGLSRA